MTWKRSAIIVGLAMMILTGSHAAAQSNDHGLDPKNFDTTANPCEDFYQYANGTWLKNNPTPPQYGAWGVFNEITERNNTLLHNILDESAADQSAAPGSNRRKIGDFYAAAMDTAKIEADGAKPLKKYFDQIAAVTDLKGLHDLIAQYHLQGIGLLFRTEIDSDLKNSNKTIMYANQGGLGLPDRDYYTRTDDEAKKLRDQYVEHIAKMLVLAGDDEATAKTAAQNILTMETRLANVSLTKVELRDPKLSYNPVTVKAGDSLTPNFSWSSYFAAGGLTTLDSFSYSHPKFFTEMNQMLKDVPLADWKNYLRWNVLRMAAPYLSSAFVNERFRFYGQTLTGTKELLPRWKRVLASTNFALGEALGQLYVEKAFPPQSKAKAIEMINNLRAALGERIKKLAWMSPATKDMALKKLAAFTPKIGYPDKWRDYSKLDIDRSSFLENITRANVFETRRQLDKIGKPVDRTEWGMTPQTVNAYYNPSFNEIVFPAGIMQPPMFDGKADDALNYGSMGSVIGHEMTHGFDDQGSQFDAEGNMKNWWTDEDKQKFDERTALLAKQYDGYIAVDSLHVNGKLTLGENIADLGGLLVSYDAFEKSLEGKPKTRIDGLTPEQRFFLGYAQGWRSNYRPQTLKLLVNTNPHSPDNFRVNGPLSNMKEFYQIFGCQKGAMIKPDSAIISIW
jgi:putative endopeptidase